MIFIIVFFVIAQFTAITLWSVFLLFLYAFNNMKYLQFRCLIKNTFCSFHDILTTFGYSLHRII